MDILGQKSSIYFVFQRRFLLSDTGTTSIKKKYGSLDVMKLNLEALRGGGGSGLDQDSGVLLIHIG